MVVGIVLMRKGEPMRAIDADALKDGYMNMGYDPNEHPEESYMEGWCKGFNAAVDHCISHVIHAPTIEPERKTGRWIGWLEPGNETYHCSACGTALYPEDLYLGGNDYPKYCPECGAQMENWQSDKEEE